MSQSRGLQSAAMSARFLGVTLKPKGLEAFAAELDRRLALPHGSVDLNSCKFLLDQHPEWIEGPFGPVMPGALSSRAKPKRRPFRKAAA